MNHEAAVETYLQRATRGLWGKKRLEVREELSAHLAERIMAQRIGGLSEREATERALAELGAPQRVSHGMARIYTLPTVMGSSLALFALCLAVVALWPKGMAQTLSGTSYFPTQSCLKTIESRKAPQHVTACFTFGNSFWVSQSALQNTLESQGVMFEHIGAPAAELLKVTVPGTTSIFIPISSSEGYYEAVYIDDKEYVKSPDYVSFWDVLQRMAINKDVDIAISGWAEPAIQLNNVKFDLGDGGKRLQGKVFYESYLSAIFDETMARLLWGTYRGLYTLSPQDLRAMARHDPETALTQRHTRLGRGSKAGEIYGLITFLKTPTAFADDYENTPKDQRQAGAPFLFQVAQLTASRELPILLPEKLSGTPTFTETFGLGKQLKPGQSVLVRLAGGNPNTGGWYELISPEDITLEPR